MPQNHSSVEKTIRVLAILSIIMASLCLLAIPSAIYVVYRHTDQQSAVPSRHLFEIGRTTSEGLASLVIDRLEYSESSKPFTAPTGKRYLTLYLNIKNTSDKPIQVLPSNDMYVKDDQGVVYYLTPYVLTDPFRAGELLPGDQIVGQLSFLVPVQGSASLYIDAAWSGKVLPFFLF